jgi:tetratricopeptide (TPR) repeat protein
LKGKRVQEALDEMIQKSLRQMTAQEGNDAPEALLKCLTVFAGRVDYEAISALKPETLTADDLDDALDVLQKWRFVRYDRGEARYSVDEMVRLALPAPEQALHARHFAHYVALHGDYDTNQAYAEDGTFAQHARIAQDWDNIQTALAWGWTQEAQKSVDWVWALDAFMMLRRTNAERQALLEKALEVAQANDYRLGLANTLLEMGDLHTMQADYEQARASYDRALKLYEDINERLGLANTLYAMGDLHRIQADYEQARASYDRALKLYEDINDRRGLANTLKAMGDLLYVQADYEQARASYDRALKLYEDINDRLGLANTLQAMGDLHRIQADYEQARASYDCALKLYEDINHRRGLAYTLRAMGELHRMQADYGTAVERYQQALALGQAIGDFASQLNSLRGLAFTYHAQRDLPNACRYAQALLTLADSHPFFQSHPVVDGWRKTFAGWGCE